MNCEYLLRRRARAPLLSYARTPDLPQPVRAAAPPRRESAQRGLGPVPPPNRKDGTIQDTVDQAPWTRDVQIFGTFLVRS